MKWVLIIFLMGVPSKHVDFNTKKACISAATVINMHPRIMPKKDDIYGNVYGGIALCFPKGKK